MKILTRVLTSIILISCAVGVGILLYGSYLLKNTSYINSENVSSLRRQSSINRKHKGVQEAPNNSRKSDYIRALLKQPSILEDNQIGQLYIEEGAINLPILQGATEENLLSGASADFNSPTMGTGNYTLISHNLNGSKNALLGNLDEVWIRVNR